MIAIVIISVSQKSRHYAAVPPVVGFKNYVSDVSAQVHTPATADTVVERITQITALFNGEVSIGTDAALCEHFLPNSITGVTVRKLTDASNPTEKTYIYI